MRLILVTLPVHRLEAVRESLARRRIERLTIADAHGLSPRRGDTAVNRLAVLEIAVNEDFFEPAIAAITMAIEATASDGRTDQAPGAGGVRPAAAPREDGVRIDVLPIHETIQLYRGVRGAEAI
jgi:nitrogen regulatory protein PII